jgi:hypothetical protein
MAQEGGNITDLVLVSLCKNERGSKCSTCGACLGAFHFVGLEGLWFYKQGQSLFGDGSIGKGLNKRGNVIYC